MNLATRIATPEGTRDGPSRLSHLESAAFLI